MNILLKIKSNKDKTEIEDILLYDYKCPEEFVKDFIKDPSTYIRKYEKNSSNILFNIKSKRSTTYAFNSRRFIVIKDKCENCINIEICKGITI